MYVLLNFVLDFFLKRVSSFNSFFLFLLLSKFKVKCFVFIY